MLLTTPRTAAIEESRMIALLKLVPVDISVTLDGHNSTDARITEIRKLYGLDRPLLVQYGARR